MKRFFLAIIFRLFLFPTASLLLNGLAIRLVDIEKRKKERNNERPCDKSDRTEKGDAAENRQKNQKLVNRNSPAHKLWPDIIINNRNRHDPPDEQSCSFQNRTSKEEIENSRNKHEGRADARNKRHDNAEAAPKNGVRNAEYPKAKPDDDAFYQPNDERAENNRIDGKLELCDDFLVVAVDERA